MPNAMQTIYSDKRNDSRNKSKDISPSQKLFYPRFRRYKYVLDGIRISSTMTTIHIQRILIDTAVLTYPIAEQHGG